MKELRTALTEQLKQPDRPTPELASLLKESPAKRTRRTFAPRADSESSKALWNSLSESLRPQNAEPVRAYRQNLVTLCIQAYYAE